ncbi:hypothetical protein [Jeongeupia sp. HS-3]|uniref:hypothetical protein n=1 Tax=Jeongeupia sp. HS-3 TaxID=1009682 RepID=UPI00190FEFD3|nr:hypothetical protein [Jeongeupia sp. HS-3]
MAVLLVDWAFWVVAAVAGITTNESAVSTAQSPKILGFINYLGVGYARITSVASYFKAAKAENVTKNQMLNGYLVDFPLKISRYLQSL